MAKMSKNGLDELFGSRLRIKVLKFFYRNYPSSFDAKTLITRLQEKSGPLRKEIGLLAGVGVLAVKGGKLSSKKYGINQDFEFFRELRDLILKSSPAEKDKMIKRIQGLGRVRLAVISGIFMNRHNIVENFNPVADLVIVADDVDKTKLRQFLKGLEAEVGAEVQFTLMNNEEFSYRYNMFDRFVRVLLEGPHEKLVNRLGI